MDWTDYFDKLPSIVSDLLTDEPFGFIPLLRAYCEKHGDERSTLLRPQPGITWAGKNIIWTKDVREHCRIGGNILALLDSALGRCGEFSDTIFLEGAGARHFSFVGQSILGRNCNLGGGTIIANVRFDSDREHAMGAIIGDRVKTGINVSIMPGTLVGKDSILGPGIRVKGIIPPGTILKDSNF